MVVSLLHVIIHILGEGIVSLRLLKRIALLINVDGLCRLNLGHFLWLANCWGHVHSCFVDASLEGDLLALPCSLLALHAASIVNSFLKSFFVEITSRLMPLLFMKPFGINRSQIFL